jgi:hypothetical protein
LAVAIELATDFLAASLAEARAELKAKRTKTAKIPIMAMTTNNSINVKPLLLFIFPLLSFTPLNALSGNPALRDYLTGVNNF